MKIKFVITALIFYTGLSVITGCDDAVKVSSQENTARPAIPDKHERNVGDNVLRYVNIARVCGRFKKMGADAKGNIADEENGSKILLEDITGVTLEQAKQKLQRLKEIEKEMLKFQDELNIFYPDMNVVIGIEITFKSTETKLEKPN